MKVLIDTNVIIDGLQSRKGFLEDAGQVMLRAYDYDGYITANSLADIFYLQHRFFHDKKKAKQSITDLTKLFGIIDTTGNDCRNALRSEMNDFEDAILMESALREDIDVIVTRNTKDFKKSTIKICTPVEFFQLLTD